MSDLNLPKVNLVVLGKGLVGSAWLEGFTEQKAKLKGLADVNVVAVANSTRFILDVNGVTKEQIVNFKQHSNVGELNQLIGQVSECQLPNVVVLDLTASSLVADNYLEFAQRGWNVISANKIPLTKSIERHKLLVQTFKQHALFWGINATVGAALPIQSSLSELLQAGDKINHVSGVFSGSLSYLLANYDGEQSFTELVREAKEAGVTEPDPRDDLSGTDVQRKLLILARVAGYSLSLEDIQVQPLLPKELLEGDLNAFWSNKTAIDSYMADQYQDAAQKGLKLAYQAKATFVDKVVEGEVKLVALGANNALTQLTPSDNVFTLNTDFYQQNPLIIRGPGAGAVVTATAVNIDLNKFILQLVAPANGSGPTTELK